MASVLMTKHMPRAKNIPASVTMKGCTLKKWMMAPITAPSATPQSSTVGITMAGLSPTFFQHVGRKDGREGDHGAHREIDAAGENDEGHADRRDQQKGVVDQQVEKTCGDAKPRYCTMPIRVETDKQRNRDQQRQILAIDLEFAFMPAPLSARFGKSRSSATFIGSE
jgi:hypothetical protein